MSSSSATRAWWGVLIAALGGVPLAHGAAPSKLAASFDAAGTRVHRLTSSIDGGLVAGVSTAGAVVVLDADAWVSASANPCTARSVALQAREVDTVGVEDGYFVYVGCADGTVHTLRWFNGVLAPYRPYVAPSDTDAASDTDTTSDSDADLDDPEIFDIAQNDIVGLWLGGDGYLYALTEAEDDRLRLHDLDPNTGVDDALTPQIEMLVRDFKYGVIAGNQDGNAGTIYVAHGGNDFSTVTLSNRALLTAAAGAGLSVAIDDIAAAPVRLGVPSGVYVADNDRGLYFYTGGGSTGGLNQTLQIVDASLDGLRSMVVTYASDRRTPEFLVLHSDEGIASYPVGTTTVLGSLGAPTASFDVPFSSVDMVEGPPGYVVASTDTGALKVLTANPWLTVTELAPTAGTRGTEVALEFSADAAGSWRVLVGGDRTGAAGEQLVSGTLDAAGPVSTTFTITEDFVEGTNELYVLFSERGTSSLGHLRAFFEVDNPPDQVVLRARDIGFGDKKLLLDFPALTASDISSYEIYLSTEAFSGEDYPTGGPVFVGDDAITNPIVVAAPASGSRVTTEINKLSNNVTYYVAVRGIDAGGLEGAMSRVVTGRPRPTSLAGAIVGERGGPACDTGLGGAGALGLTASAFAIALRRRRSAWVGALLGAVVLGASTARAEEPVSPVLAKDSTLAWSSFEAGYEFLTVKQTGLRDVYGPMFGSVRLEGGPQFFRVFEIDLGVGVLTKKGNTLDDSGVVSTEVARMTWLPLSLGATARVHVLDEQPVVPYVSAGLDWVFYRENALDAEGVADKSTRITGSKNGWHWGAGANILLDLFAPARASRLEAATGINDTWLTLGYKQQRVGPNAGGFDFSGWALAVGVKVDY